MVIGSMSAGSKIGENLAISVHRLGFNCEYQILFNASCEVFKSLQSIDSQEQAYTEEVGHDHVCTKSGRIAPYIMLYKM